MLRTITAFLSALLIVSACSRGTNDANKSEAIGNETSGQPVEIREADAGYKPVFPGQTRAPGVQTTTPYEVRIITEKLNKPWGIATLPNGRFLITEKEGAMRIVTTDGQVSDKITGLPQVEAKGQGGLLGLTLDPDFAANRTLYWMFTEKRENGNQAAVAKGTLSADERRIENARVIYRVTPAYDGNNHYGGRLLFDKSSNLYVTTGERFKEERRVHSQDSTTSLGKLLRITKEGKPADGNPFAGRANASAEIYSMGHRNVQGIDIHPQTGDVGV